MRRLRRAYPRAAYIRSVDVSPLAELGVGVGIGKDVVINVGVSLGDHSYVNRGALILSGSIGKFCSIAHYAQIGAEQHPTQHLSTSPRTYGRDNTFGAKVAVDELANPPVVGNDVWVGSAAIIQQGVTIGDGAIVAAGAVVTRDVAPYTIVGGVPAKIIRRRFSSEAASRIRQDPWWEWAPERHQELVRLIEAGEDWSNI